MNTDDRSMASETADRVTPFSQYSVAWPQEADPETAEKRPLSPPQWIGEGCHYEAPISKVGAILEAMDAIELLKRGRIDDATCFSLIDAIFNQTAVEQVDEFTTAWLSAAPQRAGRRVWAGRVVGMELDAQARRDIVIGLGNAADECEQRDAVVSVFLSLSGEGNGIKPLVAAQIIAAIYADVAASDFSEAAQNTITFVLSGDLTTEDAWTLINQAYEKEYRR